MHPAKHLQESDSMAFNDEGERVPVAWPQIDETFESALLDAGLDATDAGLAAKVHEVFLTKECSQRAAETLRMILASICTTRTGRTPEFLAILAIFSPDRSIEEIASEAGLSRQRIHFHVKKLRPILTAGASIGGYPD